MRSQLLPYSNPAASAIRFDVILVQFSRHFCLGQCTRAESPEDKTQFSRKCCPQNFEQAASPTAKRLLARPRRRNLQNERPHPTPDTNWANAQRLVSRRPRSPGITLKKRRPEPSTEPTQRRRSNHHPYRIRKTVTGNHRPKESTPPPLHQKLKYKSPYAKASLIAAWVDASVTSSGWSPNVKPR